MSSDVNMSERSDNDQVYFTVALVLEYTRYRVFDVLDKVFTSNAVIELPFPLRKIKGIEAIKSQLPHMHFDAILEKKITKFDISITSPTTAHAVTYYGVALEPGTVWIDDELVRDAEGWKIQHREIYLPPAQTSARMWFIADENYDNDRFLVTNGETEEVRSNSSMACISSTPSIMSSVE